MNTKIRSSIWITKETHRDLKLLAAEYDTTIGDLLRGFCDFHQLVGKIGDDEKRRLIQGLLHPTLTPLKSGWGDAPPFD